MFFYDANPSCAVTDGLKHFISSLFCLTLVYHQCSLPDCLTLNKIVTKKKKRDWCYILYAEQKYCPYVRPRPESL